MKLRFEAGKIVDQDRHKIYNCDDKADMQVLCRDVNEYINSLQFSLDDKEAMLERIEKVLKREREYDL